MSAFQRLRSAHRAAAILLLNTLLLLLAGEGAARLFLLASGGAPARLIAKLRPEFARRDGHPWAEAVLREQAAVRGRYWPHVGWRSHPRPGPLMTIHADGNRVVPEASCGYGAYRVLVLGGSTVFGFGVPDWGTLPAYLQQALTRRLRRPVCVRNLGQLGWTPTQDVIALVRELQDGEVPDLVIFYEGYNEVTSGGRDGVGLGTPGWDDYEGALAQDEAATHAAGTGLVEFLRGSGLGQVAGQLRRRLTAPDPDPPSPVTPAMILRADRANLASARGVAQAFGVKTWFFWQPTILAKPGPLSPAERDVVSRLGTAPALRTLIARAYADVEREAGALGIVYLGHLFDAPRAAGAFMDDCHLWPEGNTRVAEHILAAVAADLPVP